MKLSMDIMPLELHDLCTLNFLSVNDVFMEDLQISEVELTPAPHGVEFHNLYGNIFQL
jgi:hypothetical protein